MEIPLTNSDLVAVIDDEDYDLIADYPWRLEAKKGLRYAVCWKKGTKAKGAKPTMLFMHRMIVGAQPDRHVDHINGDGLDNRKANLRFATHAQNMRNRRRRNGGFSSRYKGVSRYRDGRTRPWAAEIRLNRRKIFLGSFATELDAALAYDEAARSLHGEFACPNFPNGHENRF